MKHIEPRTVYYICDICGKKYCKDEDYRIKKIKYKQFKNLKCINKRKGFYTEELYICDKCFEEMEKYIRQKVRGSDEE